MTLGLLDRLSRWWLSRRGIIRLQPMYVREPREWNASLLDISDQSETPLLEKTVWGENNEVLSIGLVMYDIEEFDRFKDEFEGKATSIRLSSDNDPVPCFCRKVAARHTPCWTAAVADFVVSPA